MQGSAAYRCTVGRWLDQPAALSHQHEPEQNVCFSTYLVPSVAAYHWSSRRSGNHWSRATSACTHIVCVPPVQKSKAKHRNQQCIPTQRCRAIQTLILVLTSAVEQHRARRQQIGFSAWVVCNEPSFTWLTRPRKRVLQSRHFGLGSEDSTRH